MMNVYELLESTGTIRLPVGPDQSLGAGFRTLRRGLLQQLDILDRLGGIARSIGMHDAEADFAMHALNMIRWVHHIDVLLLAEGEPAGCA